MEEKHEFSIMYFFAIIMVVAIHCNGGGIGLFRGWFAWSTFAIGIFAFSSGYFFTRNVNKKPITIIGNKIKRLIIPLYVWNLIYAILINILKNIGIIEYGGEINFNNVFIEPIYTGIFRFRFNLPAWFILPLFMTQIFSIAFLPFLKKKNGSYVVFLLYLILGMIGIKLAIMGYNTKWQLTLVKVAYILPFFGLGIIYKEKLEKYDKLPNYIFFIIIIALQFLTVYLNGGVINYAPSWCNDFDNVYNPIIFGFLGIAFWLRISKILVPSLKNSKIVKIIAKNTFSIMMHHLLGFFILNLGLFIFCKYIHMLEGFDFESFSTNVRYLYNPESNKTCTLYLIFGIGTSLMIVFIQNKIKYLFSKITKKYRIFDIYRIKKVKVLQQ